MTPERFRSITSGYSRLRIAIVGDFCLDRYLEIDPAHEETSIETGLPVHNVVRVRAQPGGGGDHPEQPRRPGSRTDLSQSASAAMTAKATSSAGSSPNCAGSCSISS